MKAVEKPTSLKRLIHELNRNDQELETLWRDNDKPRGKAWEKLAAPLWDEQTKVQEELAPLLLDWASKEGLGRYGHTYFGFDRWAPAKDCYRKIKERTGINESSFHIGQLLVLGGRIRSAEENKKRILAMSDEEFERDFCTRTDEGKRLKEVFLKLRAAQNKRKTRREQPLGASGVRHVQRTRFGTFMVLIPYKGKKAYLGTWPTLASARLMAAKAQAARAGLEKADI